MLNIVTTPARILAAALAIIFAVVAFVGILAHSFTGFGIGVLALALVAFVRGLAA